MRASVLALALAACATPPQIEPFSVAALISDAPSYVASRYDRAQLPTALIADLTAEEFHCQHRDAMSECGRSRRAFASCFDVVTVRIRAGAVEAEQNRRCMGASPS